MTNALENVKAVLLVGGFGTRLKSVVPTAPKPMAAVGDRPFLELLMRQLAYQGVRRVVMCTGYRADDIARELGDGRAWDVSIEYSREPQPLGTAGAVKFAAPLLAELSDFFVMNGDSFVEVDFQRLLRFHRQAAGIGSMAVIRTKNEMRYGTVHVNAEGRVAGFAEKTNADPNGLINAGVYVFSTKVLDHIPPGTSSLERDIFPKLLSLGLYALEQQGVFIDIGTPEDYARAQELRDRLYAAARPKQPSAGSANGGK
jgi:NDP-sugar pyrophosphorylase family protein